MKINKTFVIRWGGVVSRFRDSHFFRVFAILWLLGVPSLAGTISGHVYEGQGTANPVAGATINAFTMPGYADWLWPEPTTDATGYYSFTLSTPTTNGYYVRAKKEGYGTQCWNVTTTTINFHLYRPSVITGHVRIAGQPLAGIEVNAFNISWNNYLSTTTDTQGDYLLTVNVGDFYYVRVTGNIPYYQFPMVYAAQSSWDPLTATSLNVTSNSRYGGIDFNVPSIQRITGNVRNAQGNLLAGARVEVFYDSWIYETETTTDMNGDYGVSVTTPNKGYKLRVTTADYVPILYGGAAASPWSIGTTVNVATASTLGSVNFQVKQGGRISGWIGNANGQSLAGAKVELITLTGNYLTETASSSNGSYDLRGVPTGTWRVRASTQNTTVFYGDYFYLDNSLSLTLNENQHTPSINITLRLWTSASLNVRITTPSTLVVATRNIFVEGTLSYLSSVPTLTIFNRSTGLSLPGIVSGAYWVSTPTVYLTTGNNDLFAYAIVSSINVATISLRVSWWLAGAPTAVVVTMAPTLLFTPVYDAIAGEPLTISVTVTDDVTVNSVILSYWNATSNAVTLSMTRTTVTLTSQDIRATYVVIIPANLVTVTANLSYFLWATDGTFNAQTATASIRVRTVPASTAGFSLTAVLNYPNPFGAGGTQFSYILSDDAQVSIRVYNLRGELMKMLSAASGSSSGRRGHNRLAWDGQTDFAETMANGVYLYLITAKGVSGESQVKGKLAVLK